jgi:diguanylate cyclase (GGDEF)-like protein/PAS domain S-box-containing protein
MANIDHIVRALNPRDRPHAWVRALRKVRRLLVRNRRQLPGCDDCGDEKGRPKMADEKKASQRSSMLSPTAEVAAVASVTPRARVLVVDDKSSNIELLVEALSDGYEVLSATGGAAALEIAAGAMPDVVLLNVMMPGMDGYELCRRLKGQHTVQDLPVIFITGLGDVAAETRALEWGAADYITKPINPAAVRARVDNQIALKRTRARVNDQITLERTRAFAESLIENSPAAIIVTGIDYTINAINPAAEKMLWYKREELLGRETPLVLFDRSEVEIRARRLATDLGAFVSLEEAIFLADDGRQVEHGGEWTFLRKGGLTVAMQVTVTPLHCSNGQSTGFMITAYDVSERKRREEYISHVAHHDVLTGLPTRQLLMDRLAMMISRSERCKTGSALLMIDLNGFKHVNDSLGHHIGDRLLVQVADRLRSAVRAMDTVARMGGDEFVVLVSDFDNVQAAERVAEKLLAAFNAPFFINDQATVEMTASVGVCMHPAGGADAAALLRNADIAMYHAKASGQNCYRVFSREIAHLASQRHEVAMALSGALDAGEFQLHYQPQISLADGAMIGVEALLRWDSKKLGRVEPSRFIPVAEHSGLIVPLGSWVIRTACQELQKLHGEFGPELRMAVNLSVRQLDQPDLLSVIEGALAKSGLDPTCLEIEITESLLMSDSPQAALFFDGLRRLGVRVAIDDFGTGFSSMSYLLRFSVDRLKIDRCFIQDCSTNPNSATVTAAIITLAHQLKASVVAEGVETQEQIDFLRSANCDDAQGYHFCRPVSAELIAAALRTSTACSY